MIKTKEEINGMRIAGQLAAEVLEMITPFVVPGISTEELDQRCHDYIVTLKMPFQLTLAIKVMKRLSAQV